MNNVLGKKLAIFVAILIDFSTKLFTTEWHMTLCEILIVKNEITEAGFRMVICKIFPLKSQCDNMDNKVLKSASWLLLYNIYEYI
jgi:hypothetical protein